MQLSLIRKKNGRKGKKRGKDSMKRFNIPPEQTTYTGPLDLPKSLEQAETTVVRMVSIAAFTSTAGGVFNSVAAALPGNFTDWSSFAAVWDECRVLGLKVTYIPFFTANPSVTQGSVVIVTDRDSNGALTSLSAGYDYESCTLGQTERRFVHEAKMTGIEDSGFVITASPPTPWWFKFYTSGLSISTAYGELFYEMLVQFRGRN